MGFIHINRDLLKFASKIKVRLVKFYSRLGLSLIYTNLRVHCGYEVTQTINQIIANLIDQRKNLTVHAFMVCHSLVLGVSISV